MPAKTKPLALFALSLAVMALCTHWQDADGQQKKEEMKRLRHVVLLKFKESAKPEDVKAIEAAFRELPSKIDSIVDFEWGTDNSPERLSKGFTHCFFVTFADEKGRATYLPHPAHKEFVALLRPSLDDVLVIDYWADK